MTRIFIILFLLISFSLKGQNTSGTVSDTANGKKIVGASIQSMPDATDLQTVEVLGRSAKDYNSEYSFSATRISALNKDIPQSIPHERQRSCEPGPARHAWLRAQPRKKRTGSAPRTTFACSPALPGTRRLL
jgi:hypothetical protein